jgi:putative membrane protein
MKSYVWLVFLTVLFIIGPNWLIVAVNDYLFYHANPKDLTVRLSEINFLPYWAFWMGLAIWILLIILGKRFNQQFILIYRGQFHFMVSFLIWLLIELNLLLLNLLYGLVGYLGLFAMEGLILFTIIYLIRAKSTSLLVLLYGGTGIESPIDRIFNKVFKFIVKYGGIVVALWIIFRTIFSDSIRNADNLVGGLGVLFLFLVFNILISAFEIYFMFPYMLQGYYKWKFPEEYREWEGKSVEEWYGKQYLKKHKELLENE